MSTASEDTLWESLPALQQELSVAMLEFERARRKKESIITDLVPRERITRDEYQQYLQELRAEERAYHKCHEVEVKILNLLKDAILTSAVTT